MTLKTISDQPKTFAFTYDFEDFDTVQVAGSRPLAYGIYDRNILSTVNLINLQG